MHDIMKDDAPYVVPDVLRDKILKILEPEGGVYKLAEKIDISPQMLSMWLNGELKPKVRVRNRIENWLIDNAKY